MYKLILLIAVLMVQTSYVLAAEKRALLVGVSDYPTLRPDLQLPGPRNDVDMLAAILPQLGFEPKNTTRLTGRSGQNNEPTRAHILSNLQTMAELANEGDSIFLYFAGHGSRQPISDFRTKQEPTEALFLPSDIGTWDRRYGMVRNALKGADFASAIDAMRARGATVWTLFDSCHAATIVRGGDQEMRWRYVAPSVLGVPLKTTQRATTRGIAVSESKFLGNSAGKWLAFYATQGAESTPELPFRENGAMSIHGLFTHTVVQAWLRDPSQSWRQIGERVRASYAAQHRLYPTPLLEGTAIDEPLNGNATELRIWQWPLRPTETVNEWEIDAGSLHGIGSGALFDVLPEPSSPVGKRLGQMQFKRGTGFSSRLSTVGAVAIPSQAFARLVSPGIPTSILLHIDNLDSPAPAVRQALDQLRLNGPSGISFTTTGKSDGAQLLLRAKGKQLKLNPLYTNSNEGQVTIPYSTSGKELYGRLERALLRQLTARRLHKTASEPSDPGLQAGIKVQVFSATGNHWLPLNMKGQPKIRSGQQLELRITNQYRRAVDLTVLFLDSKSVLKNVYPQNDGETNRIEPGSTIELQIQIIGTSIGIEHFLVFALEAQPGDDVADFRYLSHMIPREVRGELDSTFGSSLEKTLWELEIAPPVRRGASGNRRASLLNVYSWRTFH